MIQSLVTAKARALAAVIGIAVLATLCAGLWAWGYQVGDARSDARHAEQKASAVAAAHEQYAARVQLGDRAALRATERAINAEQSLGRVKQEVSRAPITLVRSVAAACPTADDVEFTAGAVRLWNSALAGADIPAGACGTAGAPATACAAGTGIGIKAVHANGTENARRFNRCLTQLNSVLDLLDQLDAKASPTTPQQEHRK